MTHRPGKRTTGCLQDEVKAMARSKAPEGHCAICDTFGKLSFEHVPPRAAFNDRPVLVSTFEAALKRVPWERPGGQGTRQEQRGSGAYTLCERCNNNTGAWYAKPYVAWARQGMELLLRTRGKPTLAYPFYVQPLPVFKQIMAMFCSVNGPPLVRSYPELTAFLLNPERRFLDPVLSVYVYLNYEGGMRRAGLTVLGGFNATGGMTAKVISEIAAPPFGYVLAVKGGPPDPRLIDVSLFAKYATGDFEVFYFSLPVLATHLLFPGDYRSVDQIRHDYTQNMKAEREHEADLLED